MFLQSPTGPALLRPRCRRAGGARAAGRPGGAQAEGEGSGGRAGLPGVSLAVGARRPARPAALGPESPRTKESVSCAETKLLEAEDRFHRNVVPGTERRT